MTQIALPQKSVGNHAESMPFRLGMAALAFCLFFVALQTGAPQLLRDPDTFWHIRSGEWIFEHHRILTSDTFSYTAKGNYWFNTEWLSDVIYDAAYRIGGFRAVAMLAAGVCASVTTIIFWYVLARVRFSIAVGWTVLSFVAAQPHFLARPHVFSYLILTIWLIALIDAYEKNDFGWARLTQLGPLVVLWSNLHGSFTLGLLLLCVFAGFSLLENFRCGDLLKARTVIAVTCLTILCSLLNPSGIWAGVATIEVLRMEHTIPQLAESAAPNFQVYPVHLALLLGLLGCLLWSGVRLSRARLVVFLVLAAMGLRYNRGLIMFFILSPILLCQSLAEANLFFAPNLYLGTDRVLEFFRRRLRSILALSTAAVCAALAFTIWRSDIEPPDRIAPRAALAFVRSMDIRGNVFNDYRFGGFLIASGIPTFVDGRDFPFGDAFLDDYFKASSVENLKGALALLNKYDVKWTLLIPDSPLANALSEFQGWKRVYGDKSATVFVRTGQ